MGGMATAAQVTTVVKGKVLKVTETGVVFNPSNTTYELHLAGKYQGELNVLVRVRILAQGRKVLTVPAGGNFLTPIMGTPKVAQGRVVAIEGNVVTLQAGVPVTVTLPGEEHAVDLNDGPVTVGKMANITLLPGARFEVVG